MTPLGLTVVDVVTLAPAAFVLGMIVGAVVAERLRR